jgi:hypothetical protein
MNTTVHPLRSLAAPTSSGARYRARRDMAFDELLDREGRREPMVFSIISIPEVSSLQQQLFGDSAGCRLNQRPNPTGLSTERIAVQCRVGRRLFHCVPGRCWRANPAIVWPRLLHWHAESSSSTLGSPRGASLRISRAASRFRGRFGTSDSDQLLAEGEDVVRRDWLADRE